MPKLLKPEDYAVTKCGRVFSYYRELTRSIGSHGYLSVYYCGGNELVHRLVAKRYLTNPENKRTVNHKDGNKLNNHVDNLEWATDKENNRHSFEELGRKPSRGRMLVSDQEAREIMGLRGTLTQHQIAMLFECKVSLVADIHTGRRKILD